MKSAFTIGVLLLCFNALATGTNVPSKLKCYQCKVEANSLCTNDSLLPCPDDQAYDTCMTTIEKTESSFTITKTCALGPCNLRDPKQSTGLGLDHCDRSRSEYICVHCCKDDGCNKDGVDSVHPSMITVSFLLLLTMQVIFSLSK
ncbi:uncharacterized protein LOC111085674 [Limulus polyphemus]|uniref:Uncharacterized protein LOC111085674 n=1 Tax=Limulus polyphemus TaxID=6850 RepID=A0ABM1SBS3_LIMPO|nr:uncharacterized protein LOC111085674 [Limulus polyphemus]